MLEKKVGKFLERHTFSLENKSIVIGVSGGPDSLALLHYLWELQSKLNLSLVVAHVDHMFRGKESYEDAMFVKNYCEERAIAFEMERINVPEFIEASGKSSQVTARDCRYGFFAKVMEKHNIPLLALAHHGDDQVETMLMRFTRGSSGNARAGIPFIRPFKDGLVFRPFLAVTKEEIEQYCQNHQLIPRRDPSNEKGTYTRNRFRRNVLPFLKSENPQVNEQFQRFSEDLQEDEYFLQELTAAKMNTVITNRENGKVTMDINTFSVMPIPLQRRGIQLILKYLYKEQPASLSAVHIDQVISLLQRSQPSGELDFPKGLKVVQSYRLCHFILGDWEKESFYFELANPGQVMLPNGRSLTMEYTNQFIPTLQPNISLFSKSEMKLPFIIRTRRNGDRMTLKGTVGTRKIKDIFIDQKISLHERDSWPIVTNRDGEIVWLPGLKKSTYEEKEKLANSYILFTYN